MIKTLLKVIKKLFNSQLDFRTRLFNIMAIAGILISLITGIAGIFIGAGLNNLLLCMAAIVIAIVLLWYSFTRGKYQFCYMIVIIIVFLVLFPALFFSAGGYYGGMPSFFIFAVVFTVFMLEGKKTIVVVGLELAIYSSLCIYAYHNPDSIDFFDTEANLLVDIIIGFIFVSMALSVTIALHFRVYTQRQKELEAARKQVEEFAKMKSELFAGISHEMRTPLTVMSTYAQFVAEQIRESGVNEQTMADLATISGEAKRLAEMADNTLKIFMTNSETSSGMQKKSLVDMLDISCRLVRLFEPVALRSGKKISVLINENTKDSSYGEEKTGEKLPQIFGDADALTQLVWNLLQNAIIHSEGKTITLNVEPDNDSVKVIVSDDGIGIDPGILPYIFERGVSGKKEGNGIGLSICRDIAKQHHGKISIISEPDKGTKVMVLLRSLAGG